MGAGVNVSAVSEVSRLLVARLIGADFRYAALRGDRADVKLEPGMSVAQRVLVPVAATAALRECGVDEVKVESAARTLNSNARKLIEGMLAVSAANSKTCSDLQEGERDVEQVLRVFIEGATRRIQRHLPSLLAFAAILHGRHYLDFVSASMLMREHDRSEPEGRYMP